MDWSDQPAGQPAPVAPTAATPASPDASSSPVFGGAKRLIATTLLAVGLLGVGGAAVVFAADPSATPAPSATTTPNGSGGTGTTPTPPGTRPDGRVHAAGDCPNMGGSSGSGSGGSTAPSTAATTTTPSQSDL